MRVARVYIVWVACVSLSGVRVRVSVSESVSMRAMMNTCFAVRVNGDDENNGCMSNLFVIYKDTPVICFHVCMYTYANTYTLRTNYPLTYETYYCYE